MSLIILFFVLPFVWIRIQSVFTHSLADMFYKYVLILRFSRTSFLFLSFCNLFDDKTRSCFINFSFWILLIYRTFKISYLNSSILLLQSHKIAFLVKKNYTLSFFFLLPWGSSSLHFNQFCSILPLMSISHDLPNASSYYKLADLECPFN